MLKNEKITQDWKMIHVNAIALLNDNFTNLSSSLLVYLISTLMEENEFEIGTFEEGRQKGACIVHLDPNNDKQIELRVKRSSTYELILTLYPDDEETIVFRHRLEKEEINMIPVTLRELLEKVKDLGEPVSFYTSQIA
ncbi:MAG: hypothetical protein K0S12_1452 [Bacteroidetes bacterium]|nr:hypothetical protein [Bacteroidota bacterium]